MTLVGYHGFCDVDGVCVLTFLVGGAFFLSTSSGDEVSFRKGTKIGWGGEVGEREGLVLTGFRRG